MGGGGGGPVDVGDGVADAILNVFVKLTSPPTAAVGALGYGCAIVALAGGSPAGSGHWKPQSIWRMPWS